MKTDSKNKNQLQVDQMLVEAKEKYINLIKTQSKINRSISNPEVLNLGFSFDLSNIMIDLILNYANFKPIFKHHFSTGPLEWKAPTNMQMVKNIIYSLNQTQGRVQISTKHKNLFLNSTSEVCISITIKIIKHDIAILIPELNTKLIDNNFLFKLGHMECDDHQYKILFDNIPIYSTIDMVPTYAL